MHNSICSPRCKRRNTNQKWPYRVKGFSSPLESNGKPFSLAHLKHERFFFVTIGISLNAENPVATSLTPRRTAGCIRSFYPTGVDWGHPASEQNVTIAKLKWSEG